MSWWSHNALIYCSILILVVVFLRNNLLDTNTILGYGALVLLQYIHLWCNVIMVHWLELQWAYSALGFQYIGAGGWLQSELRKNLINRSNWTGNKIWFLCNLSMKLYNNCVTFIGLGLILWSRNSMLIITTTDHFPV